MDKESITSRLTRLSQVVNGRIATKESIGINGLVDSLVVLHKECLMNSKNTDNQFVKDFVRKFEPIVKELSLLRTAQRDYDLKSVIGRGHFGEVRVAFERSSGSVYAMKIIKKDSLLNQLHVSSYEEERDIMSTSSSVWIVQLHHSFQDDDHLFLVMDFHSGGDLHSLINRHDGILDESMTRFYLAEMTMAINSLHLMGYVHRDIKPENILIDRTGHVKLADFGSSCRMEENDATSHRRKMFVPVGTPDYICPELLTLAGADQSQLEGPDDVSRGEECDWWSLGVCAYEMLCGRLPFSGLSESNSKLALYSSIMNHKASLKFPEDPSSNLSEAAKSLIEGLLEERSSRLKYQQVRGHKFFGCIDFDGLRQAPPPYLPSIQSEDDTSNFSEPPQASKNPKTVHFFDDTFKTRDTKVHQGLSGRDLPFVGFTFDRVLSALGTDVRSLASPSRPENSRSSSRRSLLGDGVVKRNNSSFLDNQLLVQEARDWSVRLREAELKFQVLEKNLELTKKMREESERRMERAEEERNEAERQLFVQRNANMSLKRTLETELEKFSSVEEQTKQRTSTMVENLKEEFHQREKTFREELEGHRLMMSQLEEELALKDQQLTRAERELKDWKVMGSLNSGNNNKDNKERMIPVQQLEDVKMRLKIELKQAYITKMKSTVEKMKLVERDHRKKEESLRNKLDEASKAQLAMEKKLSASEDERMLLEKDLKLVKEKIQDYEGLEERSKALESEVKNLREIKKRERELTFELDNRNLRCQTLELTTKHLEDEMERLKKENEDIVNQSLMSLSENEDRMKIIQQQEAIIEMLKTNISAMEHQIRSLKCDLTEAKSLSREAIRLRKSRSTGHRLEMAFLGGVDYVGEKEDDDDDDVDDKNKNNNCDDDDLPNEVVSSPIRNDNEVISSYEDDDKENKPVYECLADDDDDDNEEDEGDQVLNLIETETGPSKSKKYVSCHMAAVNGKKFPLDDKFSGFDVSIQSKRKKIRSSGSRGRTSADEPIASSKTTLEVKTKDSSVLAEISLQLGNKEKRVQSKREDFGQVGGRGTSLSKMNSYGQDSVPESPHKSRGTKSWPHSAVPEASPPIICSEFTPCSPKSTTITKEDDGEDEDTSMETPKQSIQEGVDVATSPLSRRSLESSDLGSEAGHLVMTLTTRMRQSSGVIDIFNDTLDSIVEANSDVSRSGDAMAIGLARSSSQMRSSKKDKPSKIVLSEMVSRGQNVGLDKSGVLFEKDPINREDDFCQGLVERLEEFEGELRREFEETAEKSSKDKRRESTVKSLEHEIERLKMEKEGLENEKEQQKEEMLKRRESVGVKMERSLAAKDEEIAKLKESVHEQRIRVLDIKYELREKISTYEREISELKCKLLQSEIVSADLERVQRSWKEEEEELRSKVEAKEKLIEEAELKLNDTRKQLEEARSDNARTMASFNEKIEEMDKQLAEERSSNQKMKKEVEKGSEHLSSLEASNEDLKKQTKQLSDERSGLTSSVSRMQVELEEMKRENQSLARQNEQLMSTCLELESQALEMEALLKKREELKEVERLKQTANDGQVANMNLEISKLKQELEDAKEKSKQLLEKNGVLNKQLMQTESKQSQQQINLRKKEDSSSSLLKTIKDESDSRLAMITEENNQLKGELVMYKKEADNLKKEVKQLKTLTKELEEQMEMMEAIDSKTKRRISDMLQEEDAKRKEFTKKEARVAELAHQFRMESQARKNSESKVEELTKKLESTNQERRSEVERLNKQVNLQTEKILELNNQLSTTEERCSTFELEVRSLRRCLETRDEELNMLKEEISKEITRLQTIKSTNVTLSEELEARKKNERTLSDRRVELENILQSLQASYQEDKFRMEETISQQGKLIDFLQAKVESQPQKKKLFGGKRTEPTPYPVVSDWKGEAQKRNSRNYDVENIIGSSQRYRTLPPKSALPPQQHSGVALRQRPVSTVIAVNPTNQSQEDKGRRSLANPNHNFKTSIFCRPTKCIVCLGSIYFIQQSAKCLDCGAVCHPKCLPHLPFNCGMESEYSIYSAEVDRISRNSYPRTSSAARSRDNQPILLSGVVKVNGSIQMAGSKQKNPPWQKMTFAIKGTRLELSNSSGKEKPEAVFELCPSESEGEVVVESSLVSQEKVPSYSSSSLLNPLLLLEPNELMLVIVVRIEKPYGAARDGRPQPRVLYLLPSDFKEKQHLVAALETVVNGNQNSKHKIRDVKILGNLLLRLDTRRTEGRSQKMEINCTWPYNGEVILLGTSLGLFAMVLNNTPEDRPMVKLEGLPTIHSMEILPEHQMLFAIAGPDRDLVLVDLPTLQNFLVQSQAFTSGSGPRPPPIGFKGLSKATGCTVFAAKKTGGNIYLGVATLMQKILMFKYNYSSREFVLKKEYDTSQLCSCLEFGSERVVVGAGKFYHVNLETFNLADFMSPADPTLSFVADSAAKYGSQPIEVLAINEPNQPEEFLLCYYEFGVFVDGQGFRSRDENMNWSGLPLAFAFRKPFLYMVHYNSIQLVEIPPKNQPPRAPLRASINLPGACYLGPAVTPGAVYLGSSMDGVSEVVCLRGNKIPEAEKLYPSLRD